MNNWRLLLFAFIAVAQPISSFTERIIDGRCTDRDLRFLSGSRLSTYGPRSTKLSDERREIRYEIRPENDFLTRLANEKRNLVDSRERDSRDSRISADRVQLVPRVSNIVRGEQFFRNTENSDRQSRDSRVSRDNREESNRVVQRDRLTRYVRDAHQLALNQLRETRFDRYSNGNDFRFSANRMRNTRENRDGSSLQARRFGNAEARNMVRQEKEDVVRADSKNERRERRVSREIISLERRTFAFRSNPRDDGDRKILHRRAREIEDRRTTSLDRNRESTDVQRSQAQRDDSRTEFRSDTRFNRIMERRSSNRKEPRGVTRDQVTRSMRMQRDNSETRRERHEVERDVRNSRRTTRSESRDQRIEAHGLSIESRGQRIESRIQRIDSRNQRFDSRGQRFDSRGQRFDSRNQRTESQDQRTGSRDQKVESRFDEREITRSRNNRLVREARNGELNRNEVTDERFAVRREKREVSRTRDNDEFPNRDRESSYNRVLYETARIRDFTFGKTVGQEETSLTWRYLFYALQGAYIFHVLMQIAAGLKTQKPRNLSWWFPTQSLKME